VPASYTFARGSEAVSGGRLLPNLDSPLRRHRFTRKASAKSPHAPFFDLAPRPRSARCWAPSACYGRTGCQVCAAAA